MAKEFTDEASGKIIIEALPTILNMIEENRFPFIARIREDAKVTLWKKELKKHKGIQTKTH